MRPAPERPGSHLGRRGAGLHFHCATGFRASPLTRARVRLLGPCFKTGLVVSRHRRRPLAPAVRGPVPARGGATRSGRTEDSPPRSTVASGAGGPVPGRGRAERRDTFPRPRGETAKSGGRAVKLGTGQADRATFAHRLPGRPGAGRDAPPRRKCARRGHRASTAGGVRAKRIPGPAAADPPPG